MSMKTNEVEMQVFPQVEEMVESLENILHKLISGEEDFTLWQDKYKVEHLCNWKPYPYFPTNQFQKCFVISKAGDNPLGTSKPGSGSGSDYIGSPLDMPWKTATAYETEFENSVFLVDTFTYTNRFLSVSDARYICQMHASLKQDRLKQIPFFIYCDGKDKMKTVSVAVGKNIRVIEYDRGSKSKKDRYPKHSEIMKEHQVGFTQPFPQMEYCTYVFYDILKSAADEDATGMLKPITKGFFGIECKSRTFAQLHQKPPIDASCVLLIQAVLGNLEEGAFQKYKELQFVKALHNSLKTGAVEWPEIDRRPADILVEIHSFFEDLKHKKVISHSDVTMPTDTSNYDSQFASYVMGERENLDFTDHLWYILKGCKSYQELSISLTKVFEELKDFPFVPYVSQKNVTTIAKLVKNINEKEIMCPYLSSTKPIELLLEIGIEKLWKDYVMLFVGLEVVPYNFLLSFYEKFEHKGETVECLEKFHAVLEILIKVWSYLHFPKQHLSTFVRSTFKHYESIPIDPSYIFSFPVSLCSIQEFLGKINPIIWQTSIKSISDGFEKENIVLFKKASALDHSDTKQNVSYLLKNPPYHCTKITVINDGCSSLMIQNSLP